MRIGTIGTAALGLAVTVFVVGCASQSRVSVPPGVPPGPGVPVPAIDIDAPGRSADQLAEWAAGRSAELGISATALEAYGYADAVLARSAPECGIRWTTLAGIGAIESGHGTHGGAAVAADGKVSPPIRGLSLDGRPGLATVVDTDDGVLDGDSKYDRAVGPMQFIPQTWRTWGVDANGDGIADPDSIDDAALSAARYLCVSGGDLTSAEGWQRALLTYNRSGAYLRSVRDKAAGYSVGIG
ncbi:lytic murein transglycosylase [Skermania piniformis]|nr:lytic murein transglycosylase [Skermania piniformis]